MKTIKRNLIGIMEWSWQLKYDMLIIHENYIDYWLMSFIINYN